VGVREPIDVAARFGGDYDWIVDAMQGTLDDLARCRRRSIGVLIALGAVVPGTGRRAAWESGICPMCRGRGAETVLGSSTTSHGKGPYMSRKTPFAILATIVALAASVSAAEARVPTAASVAPSAQATVISAPQTNSASSASASTSGGPSLGSLIQAVIDYFTGGGPAGGEGTDTDQDSDSDTDDDRDRDSDADSDVGRDTDSGN
jgi:hypothetical protein